MTRARALICGTGTLALLLAGPAAFAGTITSGALTLNVRDAPFFIKNTAGAVLNPCGSAYRGWSEAQTHLRVSATSKYGIASWDLSYVFYDSPPTPWQHLAQAKPPTITLTGGNYDSDCGGGNDFVAAIVRATDKHGNAAVLQEEFRLAVTRWDNSEADGFSMGTWTYTGTWATQASCPNCDGGSQRYTIKAGAAATFTLNSAWQNPAGNGSHLGLMMTRGPGHGKAMLYLDGKLVTTIDTQAAITQYRMYVWDFGPLAPGTHTVRIVNAGTAGRPRIDLNAISGMTGSTMTPPALP